MEANLTIFMKNLNENNPLKEQSGFFFNATDIVG